MPLLLPPVLVDRMLGDVAAVASEEVVAVRGLDLVLEALGRHLDGGVDGEEASATRDYAGSILELADVERLGGGQDRRGSWSCTWLWCE